MRLCILGFLTALVGAGGAVAAGHARADGRPVLFAFSKAMRGDSIPLQQRGWDAAQAIKSGFDGCGFATDLLQEPVARATGEGEHPPPFVVTRDRVLGVLADYRAALRPADTIVVYSHSHGIARRARRPGGLLLDDPESSHRRPELLTWQQYAEELLRLPAQTVVALTMACHSGELVDVLNSDETLRRLWQDRRDEGRNFLVVTSQNAARRSNPRRIEGTYLNPFTYEVARALTGAADGSRPGQERAEPDGRLTLGELVEHLMTETARHTSPRDSANDPEPQTTGSYDPEAVIAMLPAAEPRADAGQAPR